MTDPVGLGRGLTNYGDPDFALYLRRSFARSMGYSQDMLAKPVIGIADTRSGFNNCHRHFPELIDAVKRGVLAAGGDCVDAVIATTFALGVLEPWMSGAGGGGAMVLYRARENRYEVIDYGMRAPNSLRVADYPLTPGAASDIFPWPRVKDDRNLQGPASIAVPGVVAGMEEAHRRHAKMPWQELLAPCVTLAGEGLLVDWWTTLTIAASAADLRRYPASAANFLKDGLPPSAPRNTFSARTVMGV